ncbi:MBL fold metallo-hydrolase [Clostridium estertheticum]|uniref:MBL fold metallo-hydrolase n=1 Tax=Clostridium estertheticum TaxID=238834 RepID=UPI001C0D0756|nr:MBL fold metallo-hydrolase [Clostridium estertheticum]WAG64793.1 MBL fold metallo-hydrolase [Clostridium estertheticum]
MSNQWRLSDISRIILTNHHDDHCGLLNKILKENNFWKFTANISSTWETIFS